jgi:hypothetical protein
MKIHNYIIKTNKAKLKARFSYLIMSKAEFRLMTSDFKTLYIYINIQYLNKKFIFNFLYSYFFLNFATHRFGTPALGVYDRLIPQLKLKKQVVDTNGLSCMRRWVGWVLWSRWRTFGFHEHTGNLFIRWITKNCSRKTLQATMYVLITHRSSYHRHIIRMSSRSKWRHFSLLPIHYLSRYCSKHLLSLIYQSINHSVIMRGLIIWRSVFWCTRFKLIPLVGL